MGANDEGGEAWEVGVPGVIVVRIDEVGEVSSEHNDSGSRVTCRLVTGASDSRGAVDPFGVGLDVDVIVAASGKSDCSS